MEWQEIDDNFIWTIPAEKAKARKTIFIPLPDSVIQILKERKNNSKYVFFNPKTQKPIQDIKTAFLYLIRTNNIPDLHIHDLRRTCATWCLRSGATLSAVSELLGHSDISITKKVYAQVMTDQKAAAINAGVDSMLHAAGFNNSGNLADNSKNQDNF